MKQRRSNSEAVPCRTIPRTAVEHRSPGPAPRPRRARAPLGAHPPPRRPSRLTRCRRRGCPPHFKDSPILSIPRQSVRPRSQPPPRLSTFLVQCSAIPILRPERGYQPGAKARRAPRALPTPGGRIFAKTIGGRQRWTRLGSQKSPRFGSSHRCELQYLTVRPGASHRKMMKAKIRV